MWSAGSCVCKLYRVPEWTLPFMTENVSPGGPPRSAAAVSDHLLDSIPPAILAQFESWIDAELALLVARWAHAASPNAQRSRGHGLRA